MTTGSGTMNQLAMLEELCRLIRDTSLCGLGQSAPNPVSTMMRHFRHEFEEHIIAHRCVAGVCARLALSPCENSCPLHMNIPRFLSIYKEGRLEDAFESVVLDNPLPASTGRVCQHPCDNRCRRQTLDEPVNMREVHRFIADSIYGSGRQEAMAARSLKRRLQPTGHRIAVVGAGPAGCAAASLLGRCGARVVLIDRAAFPRPRLCTHAIMPAGLPVLDRLGILPAVEAAGAQRWYGVRLWLNGVQFAEPLPRGRVAFYAAARNIALEQPGEFWDGLERLSPESLFIWGRRDGLVPIAFARHVRERLPAAMHCELDCGHVPQLERPAQLHAAITRFLRGPARVPAAPRARSRSAAA